MFDIKYFRPDGVSEKEKTPTDEFLDQLFHDNLKLFEKTMRSMYLLSLHGNHLTMPYSKHLYDGIFELRTGMGNNITRLLYFFDEGKVIIVTHGFLKKTQKTPMREVARALKSREIYLKRKGKHEK